MNSSFDKRVEQMKGAVGIPYAWHKYIKDKANPKSKHKEFIRCLSCLNRKTKHCPISNYLNENWTKWQTQ